jgi:hypothetical protein
MFTFSCQKVCAWASGLDSVTAWQEWAANPHSIENETRAPVKAMPPMLRRRAARLGRAALEAMYRLDPPAGQPIVFASRHGELSRSLDLLEELTREGAVSPQEFSMAVHNAEAGLFTIARKDSASVTALASENALTLSALMEAASRLPESGSVTLILCDEPIPELFKPFVKDEPFCVAAAMTLSEEKNGSGAEAMRVDFDETRGCGGEATAARSILPFLKFLFLPGQRSLGLSEDGHWALRRL